MTNSKCYQFARDVVDGKIVSGKKRIAACERFLRELKESKKSSYRWKFDIEKAYRPINFMETFMKPSKGDYDKMELLPWQHFIEGNMYGWVDKKTGLRRFRESLIVVGSGNGKSTLIVGNAAFAASKDGESGAEIYTLANSKEQARIIYNECRTQIENSPLLKTKFRSTRDGIHFDRTNSFIKSLATESKSVDGLNVHLAVFDELQDYETYDLINRIKPKTKKRKQPLIIYITTLGTVIDGPLMDYYQMGAKILAQDAALSKRASDRFFVYIDEIDENDDPENIECWGKANPSLGSLLKLEDMIDEWERVKPIPSERSNFINRQLNVFTMVDELSFLDPKTILANNKVIDVGLLKGKSCYGAFDLSETEDFTSSCLEFPLPDNEFFILSHTWVPEKKVKANREKLDWLELQRKNHLTVVPGEYVDYQLVYDWFEKMRNLYRINSIGVDPAKAFLLIQLLREKAFVVNEVRQGELTLTAPLDNMKERFLDGKIIHNNNPMFNWYLGNVKLTKRGANSTYLPTKQNKYRKIDGFAAALNAHTEWLRNSPVVIPADKKVSSVIKLGV